MKTLCIFIPSSDFDHATAIAATAWGITSGSLANDVFRQVHESVDDIFALEMFLWKQTIYLCFTANGATIDILAGMFYTAWSSCEIEVIPDFTYDIRKDDVVAAAELRLIKDSIYPTLDWKPFKSDPLAPVIGALNGFGADDRVIVQMVLQPARDNTRLHFDLFTRLANDRMVHLFRPKYWFKRNVTEAMTEGIASKIHQKLFRSNLRIAVIRSGKDPTDQDLARAKLKQLGSAFTFINHLDLNGLKTGPIYTGQKALQRFQDRYLHKPFYLSSREVGTMFHVTSLKTMPNTARVLAPKAAPPSSLPINIHDKNTCFFAATDFREQRTPFGIQRRDRSGHFYVLGNSGCGKSYLIQLLARSDLENGDGLAIIDPHGDLVDDVLKLIPQHRIDDVVVFDPTDVDFPISFNPLEQVSIELRPRVAIGFIEMFRKLFQDAWSERLEHLLRYTIMALLSTRGTTLMSVRKMLTSPDYRREIATNVDDKIVRDFWLEDFEGWASDFREEAITPLLDKVNQLLSNAMIRNVVCQPVNRLRLREIMDERKILLVRIPTGLIGEESASLLGGMIIAKIYQAAMSRADTPAEERVDFYLYVDEFQHFATGAFSEILSESRKYRLSLTLAHQYLDQIPDAVKNAIFGNVANLLCFRVGRIDAKLLEQEFQPRFTDEHISNLAVRDFYLKMVISGQVQAAISGRTLDVLFGDQNFAAAALETSRTRYSVAREHADTILENWEKGM